MSRKAKKEFVVKFPNGLEARTTARGFNAACMKVTCYRVRRAINDGIIESIDRSSE